MKNELAVMQGAIGANVLEIPEVPVVHTNTIMDVIEPTVVISNSLSVTTSFSREEAASSMMEQLEQVQFMKTSLQRLRKNTVSELHRNQDDYER